MRRKFLLFGATGSIGDSTLDVLRQRRDDFELVGFSWHNNAQKAAAIQAEYPRALSFSTAQAGHETEMHRLLDLEHDFIIVAIVGAAGVVTTLEAARRGKTILLANKESLVIAGDIVMTAARAAGATLVPVDSEHSSLYRLLKGAAALETHAHIRCAYLTASGGPLRHLNGDDFYHASKETVLKHPTWVMGQKITVDSAGLANKALEVIEAHHLFGLPYEKIQAVIHPQSYVHAMLMTNDGTVSQHVSQPDMRYPIAHAMYYPVEPPVDTVKGKAPEDYPPFEFYPIDEKKFRAYVLGRKAGQMGMYHSAVFNAANEAAVAAFLEGNIRFGEIAELIERALAEKYAAYDHTSIIGLLQYDNAARALVNRFAHTT